MAGSKLKTKGPIIALEQQTSAFATALTLAGASFTVPQNAGEIWCYPSAACHWHPTGTPTSSFGHAVAATEMFMLTHAQQGAKIIGDAGAITLTVAYMRGPGRADAAYSLSRPY